MTSPLHDHRRQGALVKRYHPHHSRGQEHPLVANDDYYDQAVWSADHKQWIITVAAPGVLANHSGPAGFHAVPYDYQLGKGIITGRAHLNADGSVNFTADYFYGAVGQTFDFGYLITDDNGHSKMAYMHFTVPDALNPP